MIELQRTDVSITSSYLRLQNSHINLDSVCAAFADQKLKLQREVAPQTCCKVSPKAPAVKVCWCLCSGGVSVKNRTVGMSVH